MPTRQRLTLLVATTSLLLLGGMPDSSKAGAPAVRTAQNEPYDAEFRITVRDAIRRGIADARDWHLRTDPHAMRQFEVAATTLWVLRRAGEAVGEPQPQGRFRVLRGRAPKTVREASFLVLALCEVPIRGGVGMAAEAGFESQDVQADLCSDDRDLLAGAVAKLLAAQFQDHGLPKEAEKRFSPSELEEISYRGGWSDDLEREDTGPMPSVESTCWAVMALDAASRRGVAVPAVRFRLGLEALLRWQQAEGGACTLRVNSAQGDKRLMWKEKATKRGFAPFVAVAGGESGYGTALGGAGLLICRDALHGQPELTPELDKRSRTAIRDALAWIQRYYSIRRDPGTKGGGSNVADAHRVEWLYALARFCITSRMRLVGRHDWYLEAASALIEQQDERGRLAAGSLDSRLALLLLLRSAWGSRHAPLLPADS